MATYEKFVNGRWVTVGVVTTVTGLSQSEKELLVTSERNTSQWNKCQKKGIK